MTKLKKILSPEEVRLGDRIEATRARTQEQLKEEIRRESELLSPDGTADVTNPEAQLGRAMHRSELVRRLKKLNPNLWYEQSLNYPTHGGMYISDSQAPYGKRMVCSFPHDRVSEFDVRQTVPKVIPDPTVALHWQTIKAVDGRIPGWRTVLLRLILDNLITPSGAENEFHITRGRSSQKWQTAIN